MMKVPDERWRKSSRSGQETNCVEVSNFGAVRDSKSPAAGVLRVQLHVFVAAMKAGSFDR